jgi:uncharacterized membrane protein YcaP (DUF421 family)
MIIVEVSYMWQVSFPYWQFVVRAALVYIAIIVLLRLGGKRQVGQMGVGEFVAILLISNAVQNSMNGGDNSITGGLILATVIIALSIGMEYITFKSKRWENILQGRPTLLVHHGQLIDRNLESERLSTRELLTLLRRQGIHNLSEVAEAILESDGYTASPNARN